MLLKVAEECQNAYIFFNESMVGFKKKFIISPINWFSAMKPFFKDHPLMTLPPQM